MREQGQCVSKYRLFRNHLIINLANFGKNLQIMWTRVCLLAVFHQGEEGTSWYIILKGSVNVVIYGKVCYLTFKLKYEENQVISILNWSNSHRPVCCVTQGVVCTLHEGDDFGKLALVNDAPRAASIVLREDNCHFLRVDKEDFNRILRVSLRTASCDAVRIPVKHTTAPCWQI